MESEKPKTKILVNELLGEFKLSDVSREAGILYPQLHRYTKDGANPTLLVLEQIADGLSKLHGKKISPSDLINDSALKKKRNKTKPG